MIKRNKNKGFTLIELLIVIGIIAILAAAVIVAINPGRQFAQARNSTRKSHISALYNAILSYRTTQGGGWGDLRDEVVRGAYREVCNTNLENPNCSGMADLSILVEEGQINEIPIDPQKDEGEDSGTGYSVAEGSIILRADLAEREERIQIGDLENFSLGLRSEPTQGGEVVDHTDQETYTQGEVAEIEAIANEGYDFTHWTATDGNIEDENSPETTITMPDEGAVATAHFEGVDVSLATQTEGGGLIEGGYDEYHYGDEVTLVANPDEGWFFDSWSGDTESIIEGGENQEDVTVIVEGDVTLKATFQKEEYNLIISTSEGGQEQNYGSGTYSLEYDREVTLRAQPDDGYHFVEWSTDEKTYESEEVVITMPAGDKSIAANFELNQYSLIYEADPNGSIDGDVSQVVTHGQDGTQVTAVADEGYHFTEWSDGYSEPQRVDANITEDQHYTAYFEESIIEVTFQGELEDLGDVNEIDLFFRYRLAGGDWVETDKETKTSTTFIEKTVDLERGVDYEVKIVGEYLDANGELVEKTGELQAFNTTN